MFQRFYKVSFQVRKVAALLVSWFCGLWSVLGLNLRINSAEPMHGFWFLSHQVTKYMYTCNLISLFLIEVWILGLQSFAPHKDHHRSLVIIMSNVGG